MKTRGRIKFIMFIIGSLLSSAVALFIPIAVLLLKIEASWELITALIIAAFSPVLILGFPYLNSLFNIQVLGGKVSITEEKKKVRGADNGKRGD